MFLKVFVGFALLFSLSAFAFSQEMLQPMLPDEMPEEKFLPAEEDWSDAELTGDGNWPGDDSVSDYDYGFVDNEPQQTTQEKDDQDLIDDRYQIFRNSARKVRLMVAVEEEEMFSANEALDERRSLVGIFDGELQRRFYDERLRLERIEYWNITQSSAESKIDRVKRYEFGANGRVAAVRENSDDEILSLTFFNPNGKVRSRRENTYENGIITSFVTYTYTYDGTGRPLREMRQLFNVKNKSPYLVRSELNVHRYSGNSLLETSFYENDVLRIRTVYQRGDPSSYIQTTYFDSGRIVRDSYINHNKISTTVTNRR